MNLDIFLRLNDAKDKLANLPWLRNIYENNNSLNSLDVTHIIENLMASLDYAMADLLKQYNYDSPISHFPLFNLNKFKFKCWMRRHYKQLKETDELYRKLEGIQYYHCESDREWMKDLRDLGNSSKHHEISKNHSRKEDRIVLHDDSGNIGIVVGSIELKKGGVIKIGNRTINKPSVWSTKTTPKNNSDPNIKNIDYVTHIFNCNNKEVVLCLNTIYNNVTKLLEEFGFTKENI